MNEQMIIKSILDTDLYKMTMMQGVLELFPNTKVSYRFKNRGDQRFNEVFLSALKKQISYMGQLSLSTEEYSWIKKNIPFFKPLYIEFLKNYRYDPTQIEASLDREDNLVLDIKGTWESTILWEVPLMAIISELYFQLIDTDWDMSGQKRKAADKGAKLAQAGCFFADFGTRRRRNFDTHDLVVETMANYGKDAWSNRFVGTSNIFLAKKHGLRPIGTMAHEWIQGMQSLESLNHCNYYALQNWVKVYNAELGIALTDTITSDMFFSNFNKRLSMMYSGIRHDSGDPFKFGEKAITHYLKIGIDPATKAIVFSDGLDTDKAIKIKKYFGNKIKVSFGIGTHFTSDFQDSPALNMVIKLWDVNGFPMVKLSDIEGKENGDKRAIDNMKWIVKNQLGL